MTIHAIHPDKTWRCASCADTGEARCPHPVYAESPETTNLWACPCGNRTRFLGIDAHGYGGPEACECRAQFDPVECRCETELTQVVHVDAETGEAVDYERHEGGASGAEIGSYTTIRCPECGQLLYQAPAREAAQSLPKPGEVIARTVHNAAVLTLLDIAGFDAKCREAEYTDVDDVWGLLYKIRDRFREALDREGVNGSLLYVAAETSTQEGA